MFQVIPVNKKKLKQFRVSEGSTLETNTILDVDIDRVVLRFLLHPSKCL